MSAKRTILLIIAAFAVLSAAAQARLVFEPDTWDFGTIRESDGRVSHTFTGVNRGDKPLVILDVVTSCGCTAPEFSRRPVTPGGTTQITVTYDPTNRPGTFTKELWIYSDERKKVASITVQGNVTPREKSLEELYPVDAGGGLRLAATLSAFSYIYQGRQTQGRSATPTLRTARSASRCVRRAQAACSASTPRSESHRASGARSTSPTSSRPTNPATAPCVTRWKSPLTAAATARRSLRTASASIRGLPTRHKRPRGPNFRKISLNLDR